VGDKDYSATPLWKKLGIKACARVAIIGAPGGFRAQLEPLPEAVRVSPRAVGSLDVIIAFETRASRIAKRFGSLRRVLDPAGGLWIAYPKRSSAIKADLTFARVQEAGLAAGLVDNKSCAIDADWSGVRFVWRLKDRPPTRR